MELYESLPETERISLGLKNLYRSFGYARYKMSKLESYEVYMQNSNFLSSKNIITFTDGSNRLVALKPDVTLGVANNVKQEEKIKKVFYDENIFRLDDKTRELKEINQIGLEYIGGDSGYASVEVVSLAIKSLSLLSDTFVLNIAHLGFFNGLLNSLVLSDKQKKKLSLSLKNKDVAGLKARAEEYGVQSDDVKLMVEILNISENAQTAIIKAEKLAKNSEMKEAVKELKEIAEVLKKENLDKNVCVDFSVINDINYYNGIVFQGYIPQIPRAVLSGGRYDNMMKRLGKTQTAMGFALTADDFERVFGSGKIYTEEELLKQETEGKKVLFKGAKNA